MPAGICSNPPMTVFIWSSPLHFRVLFWVFSSWYVSFTILTKRDSTTSGGLIKQMRLFVDSPYVSLNFSYCTSAKPCISHDGFSGMQFVIAFELQQFLTKAFSDWRKSSSKGCKR